MPTAPGPAGSAGFAAGDANLYRYGRQHANGEHIQAYRMVNGWTPAEVFVLAHFIQFLRAISSSLG
jgi:hypothetical protein